MADENWTREYEDGDVVPGTPYRVLSLLAAGGMGSVYVVEHVELGRQYVLKSLLRTLATRQDLIARMRNEWRALGKLRHPNIVDVINAGETPDGVPFYVMEHLRGETVRDRLMRLGKLPPDHAVRVAQATLRGLGAAHAIGVVHRDVKPANVFIADDGCVKILDFGIAQMRVDGAPKITGQGLAIGTPRYMSPEQAAGEKADARSDVYAVGLLLYEMLAGEGPFDDMSEITQQMLAHLNRPPRPLRQWVYLARGLEEIIERALAKSPEDRPRSAEAMASELAPFAAIGAPMLSGAPLASASALGSPLTPSGIVLNATFPFDADLGPSSPVSTGQATSGPSSAESGTPSGSIPFEGLGRPSRWWRLGAGFVAVLIAGLAVAAFGFGQREEVVRASPATPPAAVPTLAVTVTPADESAPAASASGGQLRARALRDRKRSVKTSASPSGVENPPIRLPPSGL